MPFGLQQPSKKQTPERRISRYHVPAQAVDYGDVESVQRW